MSERSIFLNALDRKDPTTRAAYLDEACAGRPELRQRIERLLQSHEVKDTFLDVPAPEQLARADQALTFLAPPGEPGALGRLDHYEVLEVVGRGGTGVVLKARDTKLQRVVAIKVLAPRLAACGGARARFVREAQAAAAVRDDHVVAIHAVSDDGPVPYLVMEFISGVTLEGRLRQGGPLGLKEILRVGMQIAKGLAAAHAQGLVHRDVKPANILLENSVQRVKLTDFGLAGADADAALPERGGIAGTPLYMSPEQARGAPTDQRSDLFSLGSVLYALCAGRPPFRADTTAAVLKQVCADAPPPLRETRPDAPAWLGEIIATLMAKEARDRFASAQEVAELLSKQLALLQQPPLAPPPGTQPGAGKAVPGPSGGATSRRTYLVLVALLIALLAALAVLFRPWQWVVPDGGPGGDVGSGRNVWQGPVRPAAPLALKRADIPPRLLALAGGGDPAQAPPELVAMLGDGRFLLPRVGQTAWLDQSPDGKVLAVPLDEDVILFEAQTGTYLRSLKGPGGRVIWVTFSRDSQLLAATTWHEGWGGAVRAWDLRADRELYTNPQPGPKVSGAAAFSADGKRLITEGDKQLRVWDARSGQEIQAVAVQPGGVASLCFSPDGRRLAVALWQGKGVKVFAWDGEKLGAARTLANELPVGAVAYSPDGKFLACGDSTGFKLRNAETLEEMRTVTIPAGQLAFAPDSRTLFAAWTNGQAKAVHTFTRWDLVAPGELPPLSVEVSVDRHYAHHCLSRDGKILFVAPGSEATYVRAIDTATGKELFPRPGHTAPLNAVAVSPDGRTLASAGEDRAVKLWDLAAGRILHTLSTHADAVFGLAFSPDGQRLASGSRDGLIVLWDVDRGTEMRTLRGHARSASHLQFSPDGRTLAAGGEGGMVKLWAVATGKEGTPLKGHTGTVRCVAFSPDGKFLASGGEDRTVRLHHLGKGDAQKFAAPQGVNVVAFSPDGRTVAAVGDAPEAAVRLWDVESGRETTWRGHARHVQGLAFSPTAPLLATCGEDGTVKLWDRTGGEPRARTIGPGPFGGPVRAVAFTPDGRYLVTANANGTVYVLRVETPGERSQGANNPRTDSHQGAFP